jgi:predicted TIM-barrel fold metal-dependent hydrolase
MGAELTDGRAGKRNEGRDEPILEPGLPIIDTHHHFYDQPSFRYMFDDYLRDVGSGHNVVASVYVATLAMARRDGPEVLRPLGEIEFANGIAAMSASGGYGPCRVNAAIVGHADLRVGDAVADLLDRALAAAPERFRGVRQSTLEPPSDEVMRFSIMPYRPTAGVMRSPGFRPGFRHLARRGLTFDASVFHHQLDDIVELAREFPDTVIVLDHMGMALGLDMSEQARAEAFHDWRVRLARVATCENVVCKVGGLGMPSWGFGFERRADPISSQELEGVWSPYIETAIDAFGVDRCMMASNFPPDGWSCGYVPLWNALKGAVSGFSPAEKAALFCETAERVYRIDLSAAAIQP